MSVFKVDKNYKVILNSDAAKLIPELAALDEDWLLYVVLVADYCDGPYRKKPLEERRSLAIKRVFGNKEVNVDRKEILSAIDSYKGLVFDIRRETLDVYKEKVRLFHKESLSPNLEIKRIKELDGAIQFLTERIEKMEVSLEADDIQEIELKGQKKLSYLEIWQVRQREYRKFKEAT
jgi:hypothetical protein